MATTNPFDLLGDDDNDDPSQLIAAQQQKVAPTPKKAPAGGGAVPVAKMPSKPLPPSQAGRQRRMFHVEGAVVVVVVALAVGAVEADLIEIWPIMKIISAATMVSLEGTNQLKMDMQEVKDVDMGMREVKDVDMGRREVKDVDIGGPRGGGFRGGRRGGFSNEDVSEGERTRRPFERRSGTGRGNEIKRDGAGRGNWGTPADEIAPESEEPVNENEKNLVDAEKQSGQEDAVEANKENPVNETEEKEPENKEMTLEEYEKVREEKRRALLALKSEERKVSVDKDLEAMQLLSSKKSDDEVFVKLGSDKDKRKDAAEKEERAKKSVSINEFLKPADGGRYRGRGRSNRGGRGGFNDEGNVANYGGFNRANYAAAPSIDDVGHFPSLGAK
ncbi:hyaluronan [Actinidia rufa]|uniref:Hyaluronan n=1 Tax=Actinidia rufa TaxID=165716 RepID=A0A7J0FU31_9ERIC|nr:hyaluronan [Actinidia rufa]